MSRKHFMYRYNKDTWICFLWIHEMTGKEKNQTMMGNFTYTYWRKNISLTFRRPFMVLIILHILRLVATEATAKTLNLFKVDYLFRSIKMRVWVLGVGTFWQIEASNYENQACTRSCGKLNFPFHFYSRKTFKRLTSYICR